MYVQYSEILFRVTRAYSMRHVLFSKPHGLLGLRRQREMTIFIEGILRGKNQEEERGTCTEEQWNVSEKR